MRRQYWTVQKNKYMDSFLDFYNTFFYKKKLKIRTVEFI